MMMSTWAFSEDWLRRKDQARPFGTLGHFDAQRRRERSVKTNAKAVVALEAIEVKIRSPRGDFSGIVEHCSVHEAVDHDAPLCLRDDPVLVAKPVALETSHRRSASHVRQQEE